MFFDFCTFLELFRDHFIRNKTVQYFHSFLVYKHCSCHFKVCLHPPFSAYLSIAVVQKPFFCLFLYETFLTHNGTSLHQLANIYCLQPALYHYFHHGGAAFSPTFSHSHYTLVVTLVLSLFLSPLSLLQHNTPLTQTIVLICNITGILIWIFYSQSERKEAPPYGRVHPNIKSHKNRLWSRGSRPRNLR